MESSAPVSTGNTFQDLPQLCETADNTERYIQYDICVTYIKKLRGLSSHANYTDRAAAAGWRS